MIGRSIAVVLAAYVALANLQLSAGTLPEKCLLTVAEGNCSETLQRWYFNNRTGICTSFTYKGCSGNANNFNSTEYCYHACNVSAVAEEPHSYSLSGNVKKGAAADPSAVSNSGPAADTVTQPTTFEQTASTSHASPTSRRRNRLNHGSSSGGSANIEGLATTHEPTLIAQPAHTTEARNPAQTSGTGSSSDSAHATGAGSASGSSTATGTGAASSSSRTKRSTSSKSRRHQTSDEVQEVDDEESTPTEESDVAEEAPVPKKSKSRHHVIKKTKTAATAAESEENDVVEKVSKKKKSTVAKKNDAARDGREDTDAIEELVAHMESTADKLQKIASIAKSAKKTTTQHKTSTEHDEVDDEEEKNKEAGDKEVEEEEKKETEESVENKNEKTTKQVSKRRHQQSRKRTNSKKSSVAVATRSGRKTKAGRKVIDVTVVSGDAVVESRTGSKLAELLRMGLDEGRKTLLNAEKTKDGEVDEADDGDIEIIGERIKTIIYDPSYVFSYTNITGDDMVSLQEIMSQSDVGTLQLIEKSEAASSKFEHTAIIGEENKVAAAHVTDTPKEASSETPSARKTESASEEKQVDSETKAPKDDEKSEKKDKHDVVAATTEK